MAKNIQTLPETAVTGSHVIEDLNAANKFKLLF